MYADAKAKCEVASRTRSQTSCCVLDTIGSDAYASLAAASALWLRVNMLKYAWRVGGFAPPARMLTACKPVHFAARALIAVARIVSVLGL